MSKVAKKVVKGKATKGKTVKAPKVAKAPKVGGVVVRNGFVKGVEIRNGKPSKASKPVKVAKPAEVQASPQKATVTPESAYREGSNYHFSVKALATLGVDTLHPFESIIPAVKKAMGYAWAEFAKKEARNEETGKDADGRILQNVSVVARKDYGAKLRELGYEVRYDGRQKVAGLFKL